MNISVCCWDGARNNECFIVNRFFILSDFIVGNFIRVFLISAHGVYISIVVVVVVDIIIAVVNVVAVYVSGNTL